MRSAKFRTCDGKIVAVVPNNVFLSTRNDEIILGVLSSDSDVYWTLGMTFEKAVKELDAALAANNVELPFQVVTTEGATPLEQADELRKSLEADRVQLDAAYRERIAKAEAEHPHGHAWNMRRDEDGGRCSICGLFVANEAQRTHGLARAIEMAEQRRREGLPPIPAGEAAKERE